jgi:hypothetical protein
MSRLPSSQHASALGSYAQGPSVVATELLMLADADLVGSSTLALDEQLDELARPLFGCATADVTTAARSVGSAMNAFARMDVSADDLHLSAVLERRSGHPLVLSVLAAEIGRRAGLTTGVYSTPDGWFAGVLRDDEPLLRLIAITRRTAPPAWDQVRRHCAHRTVASVLTGLHARHLAAEDHATAWRALSLRSRIAVPVSRCEPDRELLKATREIAV